MQRFVAAYDAKHEITMQGDKKAILVIGDKDYPFPIPMERNKNGTWSFDTEEGRREILYRRIGRNELDTIQTCLAYVDAQDEYASKDRTGAGAGVYAQRFISTPGKKDGLYWPTTQGEEESPLGDIVRRSDTSRLSCRRRTSAISRLLLQNLDQTGRGGGWRRRRLYRERQNDRWVCVGGLSSAVPQFRRNDVHR